MPDSNTRPDDRSGAPHPEPTVPDAVSTTEFYETEEGVVLYDSQNPLAWIQAKAVFDLSDMA
jgi:hypothetical protein